MEISHVSPSPVPALNMNDLSSRKQESSRWTHPAASLSRTHPLQYFTIPSHRRATDLIRGNLSCIADSQGVQRSPSPSGPKASNGNRFKKLKTRGFTLTPISKLTHTTFNSVTFICKKKSLILKRDLLYVGHSKGRLCKQN